LSSTKKPANTIIPVNDNQSPIITAKIVNTLAGMMDKLVEQDITPQTVNAACNCAEKITDLFKFHLEYDKHLTKKNLLKNNDLDFD